MTTLTMTDDLEFCDLPETAHVKLRASSESLEGRPVSMSLAATTVFAEVDPLFAVWMPAFVRACAPPVANAIDVVREFRCPTTTLSRTGLLTTFGSGDDWTPVRETVSATEVDELRRIWALPYPGDVDFDLGRIE